jgi:hypothetical protein
VAAAGGVRAAVRGQRQVVQRRPRIKGGHVISGAMLPQPPMVPGPAGRDHAADQRVRGVKVFRWRRRRRLARTPQRQPPTVLFIHQPSCAFPDPP